MSLLTDYLSSVQTLTRVSSNEYKTDCPFCSDTRNRFYINSVNDVCHCFNCGYKGNYITVVAEYEGISRGEVSKKLRNHVSIKDTDSLLASVAPAPVVKKTSYIESLYEQFLPLVPGSPFVKYLAGRGVPLHVAKHYKMREGKLLTKQEDYTNRVILPTFENNKCVYLQGRDITGTSFLKIKNPMKTTDQDVGKSECVFNLDRVKEYAPIIICEGPFDAINVGEQAVAIGGKSISNTQFSKVLQKRPSEVLVLLDPDAVKEAMDLTFRFSGYLPSYIIFIQSKDPGEASKPELDYAINNKYQVTKEVYDVYKNEEI